MSTCNAPTELSQQEEKAVLRIVRQVAHDWGADSEEVESQAWVYVAEALRSFNGTGVRKGWICHCLKKQLPGWLARSSSKKDKVQAPIARLDRGPEHFSTLGSKRESEADEDEAAGKREPLQSPSAERAKLVKSMPPYIVIRKECASNVRRCLGNEELEILRLKEDGLPLGEIASAIRMAPRTVQQRIQDIKKAIQRQAHGSGIPISAIVATVLHDEEAARSRVIDLLGA
jgi:RNA polymerase sigma factor (sigma-70 family)